MRNDGGVEAQGAEDEGAGHVRATGKDRAAGIDVGGIGPRCRRVAGVEDSLISVLHEARKKGDVHNALGDFTEACEYGADGEARGDFTFLLATDSIGEGEEPSLRLDLRRARMGRSGRCSLRCGCA